MRNQESQGLKLADLESIRLKWERRWSANYSMRQKRESILSIR